VDIVLGPSLDGTSAALDVIFPSTTLKGYGLIVYTFLRLLTSYVTPIPFTRTLPLEKKRKFMKLFLIEYTLSHVTSSVLGRNIFLSFLFPSTLRMCYFPNIRLISIFFMTQQPPVGHGLLKYHGCTITLRQTALGRTPLDG